MEKKSLHSFSFNFQWTRSAIRNCIYNAAARSKRNELSQPLNTQNSDYRNRMRMQRCVKLINNFFSRENNYIQIISRNAQLQSSIKPPVNHHLPILFMNHTRYLSIHRSITPNRPVEFAFRSRTSTGAANHPPREIRKANYKPRATRAAKPIYPVTQFPPCRARELAAENTAI